MAASARIVYGVSGGIAAVKAPEIVRLLVEEGYEVSCVLTENAARFVAPLPLATFSRRPVLSGLFEGDAHEMPHLKLAAEADLLLIAPATATVLARLAQGLADDLLALTYITTTAPTLVAPAMHDTMWAHPAVRANVETLRARGVLFTGPETGALADGTEGAGRMSEPATILRAVQTALSRSSNPSRRA